MASRKSPRFASLLAVDWGKALGKRSAWLADVDTRTVRPLEGGLWSLANVLTAARHLPGPVLVGIDVALGVPLAYFERARLTVPGWASGSDFLSWLVLALETPGFVDEIKSTEDWTHARPFIAVPSGTGALRRIWTRTGGPLLRSVDLATRAKSPFVVSGIPGTVGSGTRALWTDLLSLLRADRDFGIWPFEGSLTSISTEKHICLGEIYPRVCYALALDTLPAPLRLISKVKAPHRARALTALLATPWLRDARVAIAPHDIELARSNEDDFDALLSAVALLRCTLEDRPLERSGNHSIEGDILGVGLLDLTSAPTGDVSSTDDDSAKTLPQTRRAPRAERASRLYMCPIPGCTKSFTGSRGGWDSHAGSLINHPRWHPSELDPDRRKALFREEHSAWFRDGD